MFQEVGRSAGVGSEDALELDTAVAAKTDDSDGDGHESWWAFRDG
jgi:hypothetical protein